MKNKIFSGKGIVFIILPLFTIGLQLFIRIILDKDWNTIGITFAALGLGQIFPFLDFNHFIRSKILSIAPEYKDNNGSIEISYRLFQKKPIKNDEIEKLKTQFLIALLLNLILYLLTIWLGVMDYIFFHIVLGLICCIVSWYLIIFK